MEKTIYTMELHEKLKINDGLCWVLRVPGGWIYEFYNATDNKSEYVFVKFNTEFVF